MRRSTIGWVELILGILMIGLGIYTLINPATALSAIVIAYAIVAIVTAIADFYIYYRLESRAGMGSAMMIVSGILNLIVGVLLLLNVDLGVWTLSILFPIWFIVHCFARLMNLDVLKAFRSKFSYWIALIANVLGIIFGIVIAFNPIMGGLTMVYFVAAYLLVEGFSSVVVSFGDIGGRSTY